LNRSAGNPELHIKKNTISAYPHSSYDFWLILNVQIELKGGERLGIIGKKGQGSSSFVHMLVGSMKKIKGNAFLSGKIAYLPDKFLFSSASVRDNIAFYNSAVTDKQIR
jgi:ABC-type polysaccharide/polyol phosphate transport system ATPase subunit